MAVRSLRRRWVKWGGLILCAAIIAMWFASVVWAVVLQKRGQGWGLIVGDGGAAVWWGMSIWVTAEHRELAVISANQGTGLHGPRKLNFPDGTGVLRIPFWMILIPFAVPTAWLWWRDSQPAPPGSCRKCGYDLTGNVSGVCPECGAACGTAAPQQPQESGS